MCEFCIQHGEGKKWYENITNYTEDVFSRVNSEKNLKAYLARFYRALSADVETACRIKKRFPRIYRFLLYPMITRHLKKTHFGQIVPIEDVENILNNFPSVVRLPCICRRVTTGREKRYCYGIGMDLTPVFSDIPDFSDFDRISVMEAKEHLRQLDAEGNTHSVWTFNTPFIGALCNCDRDCMAYRFQMKMEIGKVMWKGEYVADIDPLMCNGCRECIKRCYFGGIRYDRMNITCAIQRINCYGCGICRAACPNSAISLIDRTRIPETANLW
jgi:ferredoxin